MNDILKKIGEIGIVPVVVLKDSSDALPLSEALVKGGLSCAEITFRTSAAEESIRLISKANPDILVGAGTVLTVEQADKAMNAGAKFIVSPGLNPKVVEHCLKNNYPVCPGIATPSEIECALGFGLDVVKFFPAEACGGLKMIKAMSAPYSNVKFMPTGGISSLNVAEYLECDKILACGGSWMVKSDLISEKKFDEIEKLVNEASKIVKKIRG